MNSKISIKLRAEAPMKRPSAPPMSAEIKEKKDVLGICVILRKDKSDKKNAKRVDI